MTSTHFKVVGQDAEALGTILKALGIDIYNAVSKRFEALSLDTDTLKMAFNGLATGPLGPAVKDLVSIFEQMGKAFYYAQEEVSKLIDKLLELAGIQSGNDFKMSTAGTKDPEVAARELGVTLKKTEKTESDAEHHETTPIGSSTGKSQKDESAKVDPDLMAAYLKAAGPNARTEPEIIRTWANKTDYGKIPIPPELSGYFQKHPDDVASNSSSTPAPHSSANAATDLDGNLELRIRKFCKLSIIGRRSATPSVGASEQFVSHYGISPGS